MNKSYNQEMIDLISNTNNELLLSVLEDNINALISSGETKCYRTLKRILYDLTQRKHLDGIKYLLDLEILSQNVIDKIDSFCILLSCKFGFMELLKYLEEINVNIHTKKIYVDVIFDDKYKYDQYDSDDEDARYDDYYFDSSIKCAFKYKQIEIIKYLSSTSNNIEGLTLACSISDIELVKYFIDKQSYDYQVISDGIEYACDNGDLEMVKYLMQYIPVDKRNDKYVYEYVCSNDNVDILKFLIEQNWKIDVKFTIKQAAIKGKLEIFKYLTTYYPDVKYSITRLIEDISFCGKHKVLKYILTTNKDNKLDKFIESKKFNKLFETICKRGHFKIFKILYSLNNKVDLYPSFRHACENGYLDIVQYIISNKKDFLNEDFLKNNQEYIIYLMRITFVKGHLDILKYLESLGISPSHISEYAASLVILNGHRSGQILDCIKWLIEEKKYHQYKQAIAVKAFRYNYIDVIKYLLSTGLDIGPITNMALDYVCINNNLESLECLIENKIDITINNNRAIKLAAQEGNLNIVKCLVNNGADIRTDNDCVMKISVLKNYQLLIKYLSSLNIEILDIESIDKSIKTIDTIKNPIKSSKNWIKHHSGSIYPDKLMERP